MGILEIDEQARREALKVASFIVEAPAGSGKTELLTQRFLRLLAVVEHPEEVVALTFTNKAATEMRDRILGSLERAASGEIPEAPHKRLTNDLALMALERDRMCGWNLLDHPGRLRVTTLDALCAGLARQMPFLSRFGSQPAVSDNIAEHYVTAARRTLAMVEDDTADADVVAKALSFMDNHSGRLESLLVSMLGRRDQWLHHATRIETGVLRAEVETGFSALVERDLLRAAHLLGSNLQGELMPLARYAASSVPGSFDPLLNWTAPLSASAADLLQWRTVSSMLLTSSGTFRKTVDKRSGFPATGDGAIQRQAMLSLLHRLATIDGLEDALAALSSLPAPQFDSRDWDTVECFSRLLRLAAGQLWLVFQEAGEVDFIEIAARASLALGESEAPTELAQALDYRLCHLMIDEFQDTSPGQINLVEQLTGGWAADDGRTLFVVGDPMQSIYRFRKADVGLFLNVREFGVGGIRLKHLRLFRNNRSYPAVVDWINGAFPNIFPKEDSSEAGAVQYAPSIATKVDEADSGVHIHALIEQPGADPNEEEAALVLDLILKARQRAPEERVAVLVRARSHLETIVAEIRRQAPDLRFQAVDIEGLVGRQHVQDLISLYRALRHRADRVNWLATLRAPWCGLRLADLHALAGDDHESTIWQLMQDDARLQRMTPDGVARIEHVRSVFTQAFANSDRQHPRRWLEGVWMMLGGAETLEAPTALADVNAFFALMDNLAASGKLNPDTLSSEAAKLFAQPDPLGSSVQLMTIHKSKGLEFETVILPGLHREIGGNDTSLLLWDDVTGSDGKKRLLVAPMRRKGTGNEPILYDLLRRLENDRSAHESERLLYVAATRAIRHLHLVGVAIADANKDDGLRPPPAGSLLRLLWPHQAQPVFAAALNDGPAKVAPALPTITDGFIPPLFRLRQPCVPVALQSTDAPRSTINLPIALEESEGMPRLEASVGTLVHRILQLVVEEGQSKWSVMRINQLVPAWIRWLKAQGHGMRAAMDGAEEAAIAVRQTLESDVGKWLLSPHSRGAAEQALSSKGLRKPSHHIIDRTFIAEGIRWIVDYKTVRSLASESDNLVAQAQTYSDQLARYAGLFSDEPHPVRTAIYFPLQDKLVEVDVQTSAVLPTT